jgi:hypothetical protein
LFHQLEGRILYRLHDLSHSHLQDLSVDGGL